MVDSKDGKVSRKPGDSKFKQQKLDAWKPILTPKTALPVFYVVGVIFVIFGAVLLAASNSVTDITVDYTECMNINSPAQSCATLLATDTSFTNNTSTGMRCACRLDLTIGGDFASHDSFLYYELTNFFQNHRQYVKSRYDPQLRAESDSGTADCKPLQGNVPAGLVANSIFNDTIALFLCSDPSCLSRQQITYTGQGISWSSDRAVKFKNPAAPGGVLCNAPMFATQPKPPNWAVPVCQLGTTTPEYNPFSPATGSSGVGFENEDFIVWMRTAALPTFRKLYRRFTQSITPGTYQLDIGYNYPVSSFSGKKHVVISTTSWMGGQNPFLGIAYIVVGVITLAVAAIFTFIVVFRADKRKLGDLDYLKWQ